MCVCVCVVLLLLFPRDAVSSDDDDAAAEAAAIAKAAIAKSESAVHNLETQSFSSGGHCTIFDYWHQHYHLEYQLAAPVHGH